MDIQSSTHTAQLAIKSAQLNMSRLFIGQILNANVVEKKSANTFVLQIGNQKLDAKTTPQKILNIGEQLKLIVEKQDNPTTLRVIQHDPKVVAQEAKQQLLRDNISKQAGLEKLTTVLNQISKNIKESVKRLPAPIEQQFKKLIENLPSKNTLKNEAGLKTAIKNSGIFLEAKLLTEAINKGGSKLNNASKTLNQTAQKTSELMLNPASNKSLLQPHHLEISKDLKTNLLLLSDVINKYKKTTQVEKMPSALLPMKQTTTSAIELINKNIKNSKETTAKALNQLLTTETELLSKQIESSVARIEINQSKAVIIQDNQSPLWSIEMPVKDEKDLDLLKLNIHADDNSDKDNDNERLWSTDIKITFENIGTLSAKLSIANKEVNVTLWSDNQILNNLIDSNISDLNKKIERHGLEIGKITRLKEVPIEEEQPYSNSNLINITI